MDTSNPVRVLVVNSQELVRAGLRMLLSSWENLLIVGEAGQTEQAIQAASSTNPDILVVDADPELQDGNMESVAKLAASTTARIILLTAKTDFAFLAQLAVRGVAGIVQKDHAAGDLRKAIQKVHQGELWLPRPLMAYLITSLSRKKDAEPVDPNVAKLNSLTEREREVARHVCEGLKNREIGERLFISETTVRHHLSSVFAKLSVSSRFDLILFLYRQGFTRLK